MQGALGGHVFGAQHIQQLQVIQRLQQQRAAMLAAKAAQVNQQASSSVCVECAECSECAAKQFQEGRKIIIVKICYRKCSKKTKIESMLKHQQAKRTPIFAKILKLGSELNSYVSFTFNEFKFFKSRIMINLIFYSCIDSFDNIK